MRRTASVLCLGEGQQLERGAAENSDSTNPSGGTKANYAADNKGLQLQRRHKGQGYRHPRSEL